MSKQSSRGAAWEALRQKVLTRDGWVCAYCGSPEATTVDHIVPKSAGGKDVEGNLVAACRRCNGLKSDKPLIRIPYRNDRWLVSL